MDATFFDGHDELYHHAKFGEDRTRAPAVGAKMWCFFCHASGPERLAFEGCIVRTHIQLCVRTIEHTIADFDAVYSVFSEGIALSDKLHSSHTRR